MEKVLYHNEEHIQWVISIQKKMGHIKISAKEEHIKNKPAGGKVLLN